MKRNQVLMAVVIGLTACAPMQQNVKAPAETLPKDYVIDATYDKVWSALVERATEKSWPIKTIDKASGIIATDFVILAEGPSAIGLRSIAYEPQTFLGTWTGARQTLNIFVSKLTDNQTRVKINAHYEGFEHNVSRQWVVWESNGVNEQKIAQGIGSSLNTKWSPYVPNSQATGQ